MHVVPPAPRPIVIALAAAAIGFLPAPRARACSHPYLPGPPYLVAPSDGATGVPTNVVITVYGAGVASAPGQFELRDPGGTVVQVSFEAVGASWGTGYSPTAAARLHPAVSLAPGTTYELVTRFDNGFIDAGAPTGIGSFTTGDGSDDAAPDTPVVTTASVGERHACGFDPPEACCVSGTALITATIEVAPAAEPLLYSLREADKYVAVDVPVLEPGILACDYPEFAYESGPGHLPTWWIGGPVHELALTARDLAGHESPVVYVTLSGVCSVQDQGTGALPERTNGEGAGCGCVVAGRASTAAVWPGLAVLLAVAWCRARPRART
jgi:hypothetical protein